MTKFREEAKALLGKISPYPWRGSFKQFIEGQDRLVWDHADEFVPWNNPEDFYFVLKAPELIEQYEKKLQEAEEVIEYVRNELGVKQSGYPAPVANAIDKIDEYFKEVSDA